MEGTFSQRLNHLGFDSLPLLRNDDKEKNDLGAVNSWDVLVKLNKKSFLRKLYAIIFAKKSD